MHGLVSGSSEIAVDFQSGAVSGDFSGLTIYDGNDAIGAMDDVGFAGTLDKNSAAYVADSVTIGGNAAGEGSLVKGSLFGGGASSTAGSVAAFDNAENPTKATIGVFQANRAD
ncbi:hypothetical protein [Martelella mediterranea]|uniref:hypothetical protein n=1 Tax=Martelella mediterranea TaxID=293089 RepID=UPI001E4F7BA4|nr:hypothetical protein [Martelella mediterranea]